MCLTHTYLVTFGYGLVLLFIIMFKSGDSLVLCLVPTVMLVVLS